MWNYGLIEIYCVAEIKGEERPKSCRGVISPNNCLGDKKVCKYFSWTNVQPELLNRFWKMLKEWEDEDELCSAND